MMKILAGKDTYPFGKDAIGSITYTNEGFMHVILMRADSKPVDVSLKELIEAKASKSLYYCWKYSFIISRLILIPQPVSLRPVLSKLLLFFARLQ